jgi:hypothetical protein
MRSLGDEIAVLDGMDIPPEYSRRNVIDASSGANYSGGSSYAPGLPLLPSNAGLASADEDLARGYGIAAGVLPPRTGVIDASGGANYSGGSSYAPGLPLLPSNAGLAGTYEGKPLEDADWYWGSTMGVDKSAYSRSGVLDASAGANYSGGSSYAPGLPLLPSNAGLAGLDAVSDKAFIRRLPPQAASAFKKVAGSQALQANKKNAVKLSKMLQKPIPAETYARVKQSLIKCMQTLNRQRSIRANIVRAA